MQYQYKFMCMPDELIQNIIDSFTISTSLREATVIFTNTSQLKIINLIFINAVQIYDLHYEEGKYKFIIEAQNKI